MIAFYLYLNFNDRLYHKKIFHFFIIYKFFFFNVIEFQYLKIYINLNKILDRII